MFYPLKNPSPWRKLSLITWKKANDPTAYIQADFNIQKTLKFIEKLNQSIQIKHKNNATNYKITLTHFVVKALALTLQEYPAINGIIKWDKIYLRKQIDIFLQVAVPNSENPLRDNLSGAKILQANKRTLAEISYNLHAQSLKIRNDKKDPLFQKFFQIANMLPVPILRSIIKLQEFLTYNLNINLPQIGIKPDLFGSAMVTSIGSLAMPPAFAPLVPPSRCPLIMCIGQVVDKPIVSKKNKITSAPMLGVCVTIDHRFIDGLMGSRMFKLFKDIMENPKNYFNLNEELKITSK